MKHWYNIHKATATKPAIVELNDEIGAYGVTAAAFMRDFNAIEGNEVELRVNSIGGSVFDAIAMCNGIRSSGKKVKMKVMGLAASAATLFTAVADSVEMPENTYLMIHSAMRGIMGYYNSEELKELSGSLDKIDATIASMYQARTNLGAEKIAELMATDTYLTAAEAKELGFVDEVTAATVVHASFDIDRLPENVRAIYKASADPVDPPADPVDPPTDTVAEQIADAVAAAGLADFTAVFALNFDSLAAATARISEAREIKALCAAVNKADAAAEHIRAGTKPADVRAALLSAMVADDESTHIDPVQRQDPSKAPATAKAITTDSLWASIKTRR